MAQDMNFQNQEEPTVYQAWRRGGIVGAIIHSINSPKIPKEQTNSNREGGFRVSTVTFKAEQFPVVTSNYIPGKEITEVVGVVFSSSNRKMGLSTTNIASNTFKDSYQDIELKAKTLGADAVISLVLSIERAGPTLLAFSQTVTLMGTAVKLKRK